MYLAWYAATTASYIAVCMIASTRLARRAFTCSCAMSEIVISVHGWVAGTLFQKLTTLSVIGERIACNSRSSARSAWVWVESAAGAASATIALTRSDRQRFMGFSFRLLTGVSPEDVLAGGIQPAEQTVLLAAGPGGEEEGWMALVSAGAGNRSVGTAR